MIDFLSDFLPKYFTGMTARRLFGTVLVLAGFAIISLKVFGASSIDSLVFFAILGIVVGGAGMVIVIYDVSESEHGGKYRPNQLEAIAKAHEHDKRTRIR